MHLLRIFQLITYFFFFICLWCIIITLKNNTQKPYLLSISPTKFLFFLRTRVIYILINRFRLLSSGKLAQEVKKKAAQENEMNSRSHFTWKLKGCRVFMAGKTFISKTFFQENQIQEKYHLKKLLKVKNEKRFYWTWGNVEILFKVNSMIYDCIIVSRD